MSSNEDLLKRLNDCRKNIEESKLPYAKADKIGLDAMNLLSPSKNWKKIKYFNRMNKDVKTEFRDASKNDLGKLLSLSKTGPIGRGAAKGIKWDTLLTSHMKREGTTPPSPFSDEEKSNKETADAVYEALQNTFGGLVMLDFQVPLYGYMKGPEDEKVSEVYLWQGKADAVACYEGKYVIVDWKVLELLNYWEKNSKAYGEHLHQCIVYARLLQLHLQLDYLPYILIVPIDGVSGINIHPRLFKDYPKKSKDILKEFAWSIEKPRPEPTQLAEVLRIHIDSKLLQSSELKKSESLKDGKGKLKPEMVLTELLNPKATVKDLIDALGAHELEIV